MEFILRPVYIEREKSKWGGLFKKSSDHNIEFYRMEYYAAIIGETRYKNAIEEAKANNVAEAILKATASGVADVIANIAGNKTAKKIKYRLMNPAWRVMTRTMEEIPAVLCRVDGKRSEIYPRDELYPLLGEPIAPTIEMIPALAIKTTNGEYVFFGNGIQVKDIAKEYERLKLAFNAIKELKALKSKEGGLLKNLFGNVQIPQVKIPFLTPTDHPKELQAENSPEGTQPEEKKNEQ